MADEPTPRDDQRRDAGLPFGRRRRTAASALIAMLVALALGALLNAPAMRKTALELPFGGERSFRLALVDPLATVSHWLFLDRPAKLTAVALGRPDPGPTGAPVVVVVVPTPDPTRSAKPGEKGDKPAKPLQERPLPKPFKGHPMHLYIAGDSMMGLPGMALTNLSNKTKLIKPMLDYHISTGLVRPDFFNWPAQLQAKVKAFDPGAVAVMFGANDNQAVQTPSGKIYQFGSDGWKKEYRKRVQDAIGLMFQGGVRRVYWIGQPVMPESSYNNQVRLMNEIYQGVAEKTFGRALHRRLQAVHQRQRPVLAVPARRARRDAAGARAGRRAPHLRRRPARGPGGAGRAQEGVVPQEGGRPAAEAGRIGVAGPVTPGEGCPAAARMASQQVLRRPRALV